MVSVGLNIEKQNDKIHVVDKELGIDVVVSGNGYKGKGGRKHKELIEASLNQYLLNEVTKDMKVVSGFKEGDENDPSWYNSFHSASVNLNNIWSGTSESIYNTVSKQQIEKWLQKPITYNKELRKLSMYWYGLKGAINRTYELYKNMHSLDSSLKIENPLKLDIKEDLMKIYRFDKGVNRKSVIRDILFQAVAHGTAIGYVHGTASNRYVQLLDLEYYIPKSIVNGAWQVEVDLTKFSHVNKNLTEEYPYDYQFNSKELEPKAELYAQPKEVQLAYKNFQDSRKAQERHYLLSLNRTFVVKIMCTQSERLGRPAGTPAFSDLLHKEIIRDAEIALIDRIINMMLVLKMGETGEKGFKPNGDTRVAIAKEIKKALTNQSLKGLKLIGIPYWADIEALKTDLSLFDKEKYESIDNDIMVSLGVSGIMGGSKENSFAGGQLMSAIFMTNIYSILEQIEENLFNYQYNLLVPDSTVTFKRIFNRAMTLDNKQKIEVLNKLVDRGGSIRYLLDAIGVDFDEYMVNVEYEKETRKVNDIFEPFQTSFTMGKDGGEGGRPPTNPLPDDGSGVPRPSDDG